MIKLIEAINSDLLLTAYHQIEKDIVWLESGSKKQSGLQYYDDNNIWLDAVGRAKTGVSELQFNKINPLYKNTIFEELIVKYKLLRTRFMWVGPYSAYSMHCDQTARIHIPIITNTDCYMVLKSQPVQHLAKGNVYWVNTTEAHTFINCSEHNRLHLVGAVS